MSQSGDPLQGLAREQAARFHDADSPLFQSLLMQTPFPVAVHVGPECVFVVANAPYVAMIGCDQAPDGESAVVGRRLRDVLWCDACAPLVEMVEAVYESGEPLGAREFSLRRCVEGVHTGEEAFFNLTVQPLRDERGAVFGVMTTHVDVTEQVRACAKAEAASRAKDEFLAMLGHELRNPLAPIRTALQLMRMHGDDHELAERTVIERQLSHVVRLVDDLLDVSRITRGQIELKREPVELSEIVAAAIQMASPLLEDRLHHLAIDVEEGLWLHGDATRLAQAVSNLLSNAARYTPPGGRIRVTAGCEGGEARIDVVDSGMGIAADLLPRIFDLFVQGARPLDRAEGGLGLGLTIVRTMVQLHGGRVSAESEGPGRGSCFTLRLPLCARPLGDGQSADRVRAEPRGAGEPIRVLVVDDNADAADLLAAALEEMGYETRVAHDGPCALEVVRDFTPDVALLDIGLPVMDGYQLARRLRERPGLERLRLVAVTGYGQASDVRRSHEAGFDEHAVKPVDLDQLNDIILRLHAQTVADGEAAGLGG